MTKRRTRRNPYVFLQVDGTPVETYDLDTTPLTAADVGAYTMAEVDAAIAAAVTPGALTVKDSNGFSVITTGAVASAVNQLQAFGAAAGGGPSLYCVGSDTNIGLTIGTKGSGAVTIYVPTGQTPQISGRGPDTNYDLNLSPKGTGVVKAGGVEVVTLTGTQALTNKTLTNPKVNAIKDTNGNPSLDLTATVSAANYFKLNNAAAGSGYPNFEATGSDTNIHLGLIPKGTGQVKIYGSSPALGADGSGSNLDLSLVPKGTGAVQIFVATGQTPTLKAGGADTNHDLSLFAKGTGVIKNNAVVQFTQNTTGSGSAALGANSPATTTAAPYTWLTMKSSDGSTVYVPAWK